jgi:hypothetical protein
MSRWAKSEFGVETLPKRAYLFAGGSTREKIEAVIGCFDKVLSHAHDVYERFLVTSDKGDAAVMFQLYGAPIMCDLVSVLKDGNVDEAVFIGGAFGMAEGMRVGDCVVPTQVQTLDGVTTRLGAGRYTAPNTEMTKMISTALERTQIPFRSGKSVSVPATFWHGDEREIDADTLALEMEFAAFCHCAQVVGIKAGGLLVISDTKDQGLLDKRRLPHDPLMVEAFKAIREFGDS